MRFDYIHPIIDSAINALSEMTGGRVQRGHMEFKRQSAVSKEVASMIGITGEVDGRIIIEMDNDTALTMAGSLNQSTFTELDRLALDALMELSNIVVSRAVSRLNDRGFDFKLTPPVIFTGNNLAFFGTLNLETLVIPLRSNAGDMNLDLAFRINRL